MINRKAKLLMTLPALALLSMGNEGCEKKADARRMKKLIEFKNIAAQPLNLGAAGQFDFAWVVNSQIYSVLYDTQSYTFKYQPTVLEIPATDSSGNEISKSSVDITQSNLGLQGTDLTSYKTWVQKSGGYGDAHFSTEARCMIDLPQLDIGGKINAFEMVGGGGINIGYTPAGSTTNLSGQLQAQIKTAKLNLTMNAYDPLSNTLMASTTIDQKQTSTNVNFLLNFIPFTTGLNYYYTTPLAKVTKDALTKSLKNIVGMTDQVKPENEWYTRVLRDIDPELAIMGGSNMGIKVGDQLAIYNDLHAWTGEPCNSDYIGGASIEPAAIVQVVGVGNELSYARILEPRRADPVAGAKVKMYKTVESLQAAKK